MISLIIKLVFAAWLGCFPAKSGWCRNEQVCHGVKCILSSPTDWILCYIKKNLYTKNHTAKTKRQASFQDGRLKNSTMRYEERNCTVLDYCGGYIFGQTDKVSYLSGTA